MLCKERGKKERESFGELTSEAFNRELGGQSSSTNSAPPPATHERLNRRIGQSALSAQAAIGFAHVLGLQCTGVAPFVFD